MDMETLIGAIEQRKRIAERNNQAFVDLPYEIVGDVLELLKEQENASKRNPVIVCQHCGKRIK